MDHQEHQDRDGLHHLNEHDRAIVGLQVDHFIRILSERYEIKPSEVVDAVKWVQHHKEVAERFRNAGVFALIGIVASALMIALWEGIKHGLSNVTGSKIP